MEHLLADGVSMVADGTMYLGECEGDIRRLVCFADVVNVHCRCATWIDRFRAREIESDEGRDQTRLSAKMQKIESTRHQIVEPPQTQAALIEVETDDGYQPTLTAIIDQLRCRSA